MYLEPSHLWKSNTTQSERKCIPAQAHRPLQSPLPALLIAIHWGDIYNSPTIMSDQGL